jgi:RNA polymerase sigma factor (sigma-70 family)
MAVRIPFRLPSAFAADDDRALLSRFSEERDEAAFAALVGRHARMVYGVCKRVVRDEHLAEDAFQAVFLVLAKNPHGAALASSIGGWLFGIARRVGLAARRHEERRRRAADVNPPVPTQPADFDDLLRVLDEELAALPEAYRAPLVACFLEERTQDEAAKQLGWSLSTLRRRLDRAKELLRARLTRRGATLAGGLFAGVLEPSAKAAVPSRLVEAATANPSPLAKMLAGQVARGAVAAKFALAMLVAVALGAVAWGITDGLTPPSSPETPPVRPDVAVAPAPRSAWVTITGRVVFPEKLEIPKPRKVPAGMIKDAAFFGEAVYGDVVIDEKTRGIANAVVWLRPDSDDRKAVFPAEKIYPEHVARKPTDHVVEASPAGFTPRVLAVRAGDRIVFGNPTPTLFNVRYQSIGPADQPQSPMGDETNEFNLIVPAGKTYTTKPVAAARICDTVADSIHPWVHAYVWAFDHPYFAVTDSRGNFTIPSAPAGNWRLVIWHEKVGYLNGAKGRTGERITIGGDGKLEPRVLESDNWDKE